MIEHPLRIQRCLPGHGSQGTSVKPSNDPIPSLKERGPGAPPEQLPARGSHRPVRARSSAYGSSNHGFTARDVIRGGCVDTKPRFDALAVCPRHGAMIRRRASLHGVRSPASPVLSRRYDFLPSVPPLFVAFARRNHAVRPGVRSSRCQTCYPETGGLWVRRTPCR